MVTDFSPDDYLRRAIDQALADPDSARNQTRRRWGSAVFEVAAALVAVALLPAESARESVRDYEARAHDPRWGGHAIPSRRPAGWQAVAGDDGAWTPPRVVSIERDIARPWGSLRLHYAGLGAGSTSLVVSTEVSSPTDRPGHRVAGSDPNWIHDLVEIADDRGRMATLETWGGLLQRCILDGVLSPSTKWIRIGAEHIALPAPEPPTVGHFGALPQPDPAVAHLWRRMQTYFCFFPLPGPLPLIDTAIDTLLAAGALSAASPVIAQVRAVARAFTSQPADPAGLPAPWQSLLTGWLRSDGAVGAVAQSLLSPTVGEASFHIEGLVVRGAEFILYLSTSPAWQLTAAPFVGLEVAVPLSWWAEDDLGNSYLGCVGSAQTGNWGDRAEGSIRFWPGLHPNACELRVVATGAAMRAVCPIALPEWGA